MEFFRRLFNKPPKTTAPTSPYDGHNTIAEHAFFEAGSLLHGGENSDKKVEMTAAEINAPFEAQAEKDRKQAELAEAQRRQAEAKMAQTREIQAQKDAQKIEATRAKIEQTAKPAVQSPAPESLPGTMKTVVIEHSPLVPKPELTVLQGGAPAAVKTEKVTWHTDGTASELPISGTEALNEEIFFGQPKKGDVVNRASISELNPQEKPVTPSETPKTEEKRAA